MNFPLFRFFFQSYDYLSGACGEHAPSFERRAYSNHPHGGPFVAEGEQQLLLPFYQSCEWSAACQVIPCEEEYHDQD